MNPRVLFCDNHLIIAQKPTGLATHSDQCNEHSLTAWVRSWIKESFKKPNCGFAEPAHRLDKVTSGLVVFAKTSKALSRLMGEIRQGRWNKSYYALVEAKDVPSEGVLEHYLVRSAFRSHVQSAPIGALAKTSYRFLGKREGLCLLMLKPQTGRYHQLRAQLAHVGWPICGDCKYGAGPIAEEQSIYLHHGKCEISHPVLQKIMSFKSPPPTNWPIWAFAYLQDLLI